MPDAITYGQDCGVLFVRPGLLPPLSGSLVSLPLVSLMSPKVCILIHMSLSVEGRTAMRSHWLCMALFEKLS